MLYVAGGEGVGFPEIGPYEVTSVSFLPGGDQMPAKDTKLQWPNKVLAGLQETVADMIAEFDPQVVLQKAVERMAELVGADIVTIHIYDPLTGSGN